MAIAVRLRCSECTTVREEKLDADAKEIVCPVCGRRIQNLTADEHAEIEASQKKQFLFSVIGLVCFALAVVCLYLWAGDAATWVSTDDQNYWTTIGKTPEPNVGFLAGAIICALTALILGTLGSRHRHVVEF